MVTVLRMHGSLFSDAIIFPLLLLFFPITGDSLHGFRPIRTRIIYPVHVILRFKFVQNLFSLKQCRILRKFRGCFFFYACIIQPKSNSIVQKYILLYCY